MFLIDFLPFWIFHMLFLAGIAGLLVSQFLDLPFIAQYKLPAQILSIVVLTVAVYFEGGISNQEKWEKRVSELETKVAVAEEKSKAANVEVASLVKEKEQLVKQKQIIIQERIVKQSAIIDANCTVPIEAIQILNEAASK